ncbi:DUF5677 domain-containing protein [Nocardioides conyzicola]|uniref:Uncharacterized protein n=1 Tax=Nocardioides conyzicola TaxID=1651781 RepID=A0ABP8X751_9ACTN
MFHAPLPRLTTILATTSKSMVDKLKKLGVLQEGFRPRRHREVEPPRLNRFDSIARTTLDRVLKEQAGADPEGHYERLHELIEDGAFERILSDADGKVTDLIYTSLQQSAPKLVRSIRANERRLEKTMREVWGQADEIFQASNYIGYELGADIARNNPHPSPKLRALLGAHGRALRTGSEVRQLAMSGFHDGAGARWRSLHELAVLIDVLAKSDVEISERYLAYARIESWWDVKTFQEHADALGHHPFSDEDVDAAKTAAREVTERWGLEMDKPHGWAFPLFPGQKAVRFTDLESLAGLSHMRPYYRLGNHHIHSGPRAGELNYGDVTPRGTPAITVGASVFGDIAETCHGAMISVHHATANLVVAHLSERDGKREGMGLDLLVGLKAQARFVEDAGDLWSSAADEARLRGWFTHRPSD